MLNFWLFDPLRNLALSFGVVVHVGILVVRIHHLFVALGEPHLLANLVVLRKLAIVALEGIGHPHLAVLHHLVALVHHPLCVKAVFEAHRVVVVIVDPDLVVLIQCWVRLVVPICS